MGLQKTFIENLKYYRKLKSISQKDLSIALNKGFNYVNSIECGVSFPPPKVIDKIAIILDIEAEVLFSKNGCPENIKQEYISKAPQVLKEELITSIVKEINRVLG